MGINYRAARAASHEGTWIACQSGPWTSREVSKVYATFPAVPPEATLVLGSALRARPAPGELEEYLQQLDLLRQAQAVQYSPELHPPHLRAFFNPEVPVQAYSTFEDLVAGDIPGPMVCLGLDESEFAALKARTVALDHDKEAHQPCGPFPISLSNLRRRHLASTMPPPVSAALYDLDDDQLLCALRPHTAHPPASLSKLMTLSVTQHGLQRRGVSPDQPVLMSETAAAVNSWWGIPAGSMPTIGELMRAAAIVSCNEAANALGEWYSGTQEKFTRVMNREAVRLGMSATCFASPSGLGSTQTTTALDMIRLGRHITTQRQALMPIFQMEEFTFGDKTAPATNRLITRITGATGLKTGTLVGVSYNLLFSFTRRQKNYIAVVLGAPSRRARDRVITSLVKMARDSVISGPEPTPR